MAVLRILLRLSCLLIRLLHPLLLPDPTPSNPDPLRENPTPSNPDPLREDPTPSNPPPLREDPTPSNPAAIGNDLIREILKLLPVKSLMRFKCVSRDWLCIITDPSFTGAYTGGFRGPIVFRPDGIRDTYEMIHYVSIDDTGSTATCEAYLHSTVDHGGKVLAHSGVVNGLICFYNGNISWLYNIATRERVQLPLSGPVPTGDGQSWGSTYRLGFDPVSKLYKLLKISAIYNFRVGEREDPLAFRYSEILTIGVDSSWRVIDSLPPPSKQLRSAGICTNGVIYEMEFQYNRRHRFLSAFHVAEERFHTVPHPPDFDHDPDGLICTLYLLRFGGGAGPALVSGGDRPDTANIYRYNYGEGGGESQGVWDNCEILTLPVKYVVLEGILPSGKVLISDYSPSDPPRLFLYDPNKKESEKLVVTRWNVGRELGVPISPRRDSYYNAENLVSLKRMTSST